MTTRVPPLLLTAALLLPTSTAGAVDPFEIQVYEGDINAAGQVGLEVHTNFVADGRTTGDDGRAAPDRMWRTTLEPSFGVLPWWELGAYFQIALGTQQGSGHFGGFKLRSKVIVPRARTGDFIFGLNVELGRGSASLGGPDWGTEFRPILVYAPGALMIAVNPILGWAVTGDHHVAPEFEPAVKLRWNTARHVGVGLEYYAGLGALSDPAPLDEQEHILYAIADLVDLPFDLNVGVGRGFTQATDRWTVKAIFGVAF